MHSASGATAVVVASYIQAHCWRVSALPLPGDSLAAHASSIEPGGKGLNVAIALARLGVQVVPLMACGRDDAGDRLLALLEREGITTRHVLRVDAPSGHGGGFIDADGANMIAVDPGANALLDATAVQRAQPEIAAAGMVYAQFESPQTAIAHAFTLARAAGVPTVLNPSPAQPALPALRALTDTLLLNEREGSALAAAQREGGSAAGDSWLPEELDRAGWAARCVVQTLGAYGARLWLREADNPVPQPIMHPGYAVEAVDTVGCGDAFAAAFCAERLHGASLPQALRAANAAGAIVAARAGVLPALPTRQALQAFIDRREGG